MCLRSIIKNRQHRAVLPLLLLAACGLMLLLLLKPAETAGNRAVLASEGLNHYDFSLIFRPEKQTLAVTMELEYTNRTGSALSELMLRTWAGAYHSQETSPAAASSLYEQCYPQGFSPGGIQLEGCWWNDMPVDAQFQDAAQTVLSVPVGVLASSEGGRLRLRCQLTIPECAHRFGHDQDTWQFGNALPILSVYQQDGWRQDPYEAIGEPFLSQCANYSVTLVTPEGYACAATGRCMEKAKTADGAVRYLLKAEAVREFAFALSSGWVQASARSHGVLVSAYAAERSQASRAVQYAAKALEIYSALYGEYPYDTFSLCAAEFPFGGMEYPGLIFIGAPYFAADRKDSLELVIAHETAHQWFYGMVGSDPFNHPWQDEALCEYATLRYVRERYGAGAYENLRLLRADAPMRENIPFPLVPDSPISDFSRLDIYSSIVYGRGLAFLLAAEEMTGKLDAFLAEYCRRFAFRIASREDFELLLCAETGADLMPLMKDYLDTPL